MAITFDQAVTANEFHAHCTAAVGPRGGINHNPVVWRRNGKTQVWKTRPGEFRVPIKFGIYSTDQLWHYDRGLVYVASECPVCTLVRHYRDMPDVLRSLLAARNGESTNDCNDPGTLRDALVALESGVPCDSVDTTALAHAVNVYMAGKNA